MSAPLIIQRVIPHYRVALFEEIHRRTGARVVAADCPPGGTFLNVADPRNYDWAIPAPFRFPTPENAFRAEIPLDEILDAYRPPCVVAEFGMRISTTRDLPIVRRRERLPAFAFWSHGWQMERGFSTPVDAAVQQLRLMRLATADVLAAYTEEGAAWLRARLPQIPTIALGNALDAAEMDAAAAAIAPQRGGRPQLLAVGRLTADKRFDGAIQIFRKVREDHPDAALTIIGDGPERAALERLAGPDLGRGITFAGALHGERNLAPHFAGADVLVMPGAAGLSVNHALGYRLPVIAFARVPDGPRHHPEIEYVVDGVSGLIVQRPDFTAMGARLSAAVITGELDRVRQRLAISSPAPTIGQVAERFEQLFQQLEQRARRGYTSARDIRGPGLSNASNSARLAPPRGKRIGFLWENFGPMHDDRCQAMAAALGHPEAVVGIELYSRSDTYQWRTAPAEGFRKITLHPTGERPAIGSISLEIVRACLSERLGSVFLCHYERPEIFLAAVMLRALGFRVFSMGDSKFDDYPRRLMWEVLKSIAHAPYMGALAGSPRTKDYLRLLGYRPEMIETGYDAISVDRIRRLAEGAGTRPFAERDFLIVARLVPKKNIKTAIEAFRLFAVDDAHGRKLVICGSGPLEAELKAQAAAAGLEGRVVFAGFEPIDAIARRMADSLALLLPSIEEQFGLVIPEALAVGLPVIVATACGARDELVRSGVNGFVVEPENAAGWAFFMGSLSNDEALHRRLSATAYEVAGNGDVSIFTESVKRVLGCRDAGAQVQEPPKQGPRLQRFNGSLA